ncbi:hypothetical protein Ddc_18149 [Ditylenchus destructor]|nr:hypothetical protein Ddc_18149 [Ditylenchus destructor]
MASNGNQLQHPFNTNWPAAIADACYHLAPQRSFTSFPPQPLCNIAVPTSNFSQNGSYNRPPSPQMTALIDGYESRITQLDQKIRHLKSSEQQKLFSLNEKCAKLSDQLLKKDSELEALKQSKDNSRKSVRNATTQIHFDNCSTQCEQKTRDLKEKVCKIQAEQKDLFNEVKRYKDRFERARKENDVLMKKGLSEDSCKNHSLEISELRQNYKKVREENEVLKTNLKTIFDASKSRIENLQSNLNRQTAELQQCNQKAEKEIRELKVTNERISRESQQKMTQTISEKDANAIAKLSEIVAGIERNLVRQIRDNSSQLSKLNDKNKKLEEENELLKANNKAQSQNLKDELKHAKEANARLSDMNKELEKETKRFWDKIYASPNDGQGSSECKNENGKSGPTAPKKKKSE